MRPSDESFVRLFDSCGAASKHASRNSFEGGPSQQRPPMPRPRVRVRRSSPRIAIIQKNKINATARIQEMDVVVVVVVRFVAVGALG
jgi:hypothetical protein